MARPNEKQGLLRPDEFQGLCETRIRVPRPCHARTCPAHHLARPQPHAHFLTRKFSFLVGL
eukprot:2275769-Rhodomonas_salina.2